IRDRTVTGVQTCALPIYRLALAIEAANASRFGLAASVWGRDLRAARAVARRLDAGMVTVNEAVTPSAHAAAPFGGVKASGFGRKIGRAWGRERGGRSGVG